MKVTRRGLGRAALAGAAAQPASRAVAQQPARSDPLVPGTKAPPPVDLGDPEAGKTPRLAPLNPFAPGAGIGIGHRFPPEPKPEVFAFYRAAGIEYGSILARLDQISYDYMARARDRMEQHGVRLLNVNVVGLHCDPVIVLGLPGVEQNLERYKQFLRDAGKAGVPYTTFTAIWPTYGCHTASRAFRGRAAKECGSLTRP